MRLFLLSAVSIVALGAPASAETLREALARAYEANPTITASRAQQRANDENVPIAKADGRPSFSVTGNLNESPINTGNAFGNPERSLSANAGVTIPLYSGGAVRNSIRAAQTRVEAGQANLRGTEASLFTEVGGA